MRNQVEACGPSVLAIVVKFSSDFCFDKLNRRAGVLLYIYVYPASLKFISGEL